VAAQPRDAAVDAKEPKKARRAMIESIAIAEQPPKGRKLEIYPERLAKQLGMQLTKTEWFGAATRPLPPFVIPRPATIRVDIKYDYRVEKRTNDLTVLVAVHAQLRWSDGATALAPSEKVLIQRTLPKAKQTMDVSEHVAGEISDAVKLAGKGIIQKAELLDADPDRLRLVMGSMDDDIVLWALAIAGERKQVALFNTVVKLLSSPNRPVREAAVGTLVAMGDRRAVPHLTHIAEFRDKRMLTILIDAVASLGGPEAATFLDFVASGHTDPDIRKIARQARARMKRRKKRGQKHAKP